MLSATLYPLPPQLIKSLNYNSQKNLHFNFIIKKKQNKKLHTSGICNLSDNVNDYHIIAQGKTSIPGVDDGEEMGLTDVR